jgi:hypothetical protein
MLDTVIDSFEKPYKVYAKLSMVKMATIVENYGLVTRRKSQEAKPRNENFFPHH